MTAGRGGARTRCASALYFAYGSNLDEAQMARRCPGVESSGRATLHGYTLAFAGASATRGGAVATIVRVAGGTVEGAVYRVTAAQLARLDAFEGAPSFYERARVSVDAAGLRRRATTYVLARRHFFLAMPTLAYLRQIAGGYRALGLPLTGLTDALAISLAVDELEPVDFADTGPNVPTTPTRGIELEDERE